MKITNVKINGIKNPVGYLYDYISCSWDVEETESTKQIEALVEVSEDTNFENIIHTINNEDVKQIGTVLKMQLKPRTTYFFRVNVKGDKGDSAVSDVHYFA